MMGGKFMKMYMRPFIPKYAGGENLASITKVLFHVSKKEQQHNNEVVVGVVYKFYLITTTVVFIHAYAACIFVCFFLFFFSKRFRLKSKPKKLTSA